jgi:hypothetical protein
MTATLFARPLFRYTLAVFALVPALCLAGCNKVKQTVGLAPPEADPMQVPDETPLIVPPGLYNRPLPQPRPGAPRPGGRSASDQGRAALVQGEESQAGALAPVGGDDVVITAPPAGGADVVVRKAEEQAARADAPAKN